MSMQTRPVGAVTQTSPAVLSAKVQRSNADIQTRFKAAPTVANTSVSRQTGLAGNWNNSTDPASLTLTPKSGATSQMRTNTLVVCP